MKKNYMNEEKKKENFTNKIKTSKCTTLHYIKPRKHMVSSMSNWFSYLNISEFCLMWHITNLMIWNLNQTLPLKGLGRMYLLLPVYPAVMRIMLDRSSKTVLLRPKGSNMCKMVWRVPGRGDGHTHRHCNFKTKTVMKPVKWKV